MTACGNCGSKQGPFDRVIVGPKKRARVIVVCAHGPVDDQGHGRGTLACLERRAKIDQERWG